MLNEMMMKSLLKAVDFEKLAKLPQVQELIAIAGEIRDSFRQIKENQDLIITRLDKIDAQMNSERAQPENVPAISMDAE